MTMRSLLKTATLAVALGFGTATPALAAGEAPTPPAQDWQFNGLFGTFDLAAVQRGYQVYREVCATCHAMHLLSFRNLRDIGFSEAEVAALAEQFVIVDGPNADGEMEERPGIPADRFPSPFPNEQAARAANGGAYPVDLSVIAKARQYGPDYLYALLTGYEEPPENFELSAGRHYNAYFPGHQITMPDMLVDDGVQYHDGTEATAEQQAWDVANFMMWAAEPHMEERKQMGVRVVLFLIVFTAIMYAVKRKVWADVH